MELLGTKNAKDNFKQQLDIVNQKLLASNNIFDISTELIEILNIILNKNDNELLDKDIYLLNVILTDNAQIKTIPIIKILSNELKSRLVRIHAFSNIETNNNIPIEKETINPIVDPVNVDEENLPDSMKNVPLAVRGKIHDGKEKFIPVNNDFSLPAPGQIGNLTVRGVDDEKNLWVRRELVIDSEGYFVREISCGYENASDEEEIYSSKYLDSLKDELNKNNNDTTNTIKEAEEACNTNGETAAETGVTKND